MTKRNFYLTIVLLLLLPTVVSLALAGETIEGIIATVNRQPLFQSDWDNAVCFEAFMQQKRLADVTEQERIAALQRLIDRQLLQTQMVDGSTLRPKDQDVSADIAKLRAQVPGGSDEIDWKSLLASYGLTEATLAEHLRSEVEVINFIDVRLRPSVRVQDEEIQSYYRAHLLPELRQSGSKEISFEEAEPKIRELLVQQHMDEMLDAWLHNLRQQSRIQTTVPLPSLNAAVAGSAAAGGK